MSYNILIVDDEQIERDGIRYLIDKFNLELNIAEAEDGQDALIYLEKNPVDILFTDIKMPFMDGLELSYRAREIYPNIKIIIYSAYGEFEYARKAISVSAFHYILKPIAIDEFANVVSRVIALCREEEIKREESEKVWTVYKNAIEYEKEKFLLDLLNKTGTTGELEDRAELINIGFNNQYIQNIMFDFKSRFFDGNSDTFIALLQKKIPAKYEYVNLNEHQSILFIVNQEPFEKAFISDIGESIKTSIKECFDTNVTIVFGKALDSIYNIADEFNNMETKLEEKFFFEESIVLFTYGDFPYKTDTDETFENSIVLNIHKCIDSNDFRSVKTGVEIFFDKLRGNKQFSSAYTKYLCMEIVKKAFEKAAKNSQSEIKRYVEEIFKCNTLAQLSQSVQQAIDMITPESEYDDENKNKKVIKEIIGIIEENYMMDISLEWVADKVFLSPGYLSYLFKREVGQSLVKYITSYRLEKARHLLQNTNMKIVDICEKVGYDNVSYFCLIFKNYYGLSPAKFRENGVAT